MESQDLATKEHLRRQGIIYIYIIYYNIVLPVLFNIIPGLLILINNSALWFFMRNYTRSMKKRSEQDKASATSQQLQPSQQQASQSKSVTKNLTKPRRTFDTMTKSQQSHYFTIITLGVWMLLTSIPFYIFTTWNWAASLRVISHADTHKTRLYMSIQAVTSAFFNSNHCVNILIYMAFYKVSFFLIFSKKLEKKLPAHSLVILNFNALD